MLQDQDPVLDIATRFFKDHSDAAQSAHPIEPKSAACEWLGLQWSIIQEMGLPFAFLSEGEGGFDISPVTAFGLIRLGGYHAMPLPLAETMIANFLLAKAGLPLAEGVASLGVGPDLHEGLVTGRAPRVAYGRFAQTIVLICGERLVRVGAGEAVTLSHNMAGEARDDLQWTGAEALSGASPVDLVGFRLLCAIARAAAMAGALHHALDLTVDYANQRQQFGRAIGRFQAIQQQLAAMAGQVSAARTAADFAASMLPSLGREDFKLAAMAAKIRAGEAASLGSAIAHQIHAAIGFTQEHRLQLLTRRLWSWRDEWGREAEWSEVLGARVAQAGPNGLWPLLTATGTAA